jgi:NhaD family Na+/H+ antiporter
MDHMLQLTDHWVGYLSLTIFVIAYMVVMVEEFTHLRKSKPVILAAGIIWALIAFQYEKFGLSEIVVDSIKHSLIEYAELFLFLLVAMTYINAMQERLVFEKLREWLIIKGFNYRQLFVITGIIAFFMSPIADNLTTALVLCAVVLAVGGKNIRFVSIGCVNIVVAANAGGAFSPFGDITTLMVWQKGIVDFFTFFTLFVPSVVNYIIPGAIMYFAVPKEAPEEVSNQAVETKRGAKRIMFLFICTIATAVSFHSFLHLPPTFGMMTGLAYLQFFAYYLKITHHKDLQLHKSKEDPQKLGDPIPFDVFNKIARAEWDTLLFFFGIILSVGGLGIIGYLSLTSEMLYTNWGPTNANIAVGILSAIVDNIPVMFAVLTMNPEMSLGQWLLVTLTTGVGGSLLSIGSAAGVALMGQARGRYTFFNHLKWTPVIALGYFASIYVHLLINSSMFN